MRHPLRLVLAVASVLVASAGVALAGNSTLTYTAAQDTQIQTRLVPLYNKAHCGRFGLAPSCTSANLVTAGCVVQVTKTVTVESCTIFTGDAAGEQAFLQEQANQRLVDVLAALTNSDNQDFCTSWKGLSTAAQNAQCAVQGLPNACSPCP